MATSDKVLGGRQRNSIQLTLISKSLRESPHRTAAESLAKEDTAECVELLSATIPMPTECKPQLHEEIEGTLRKHIQGCEYVITNYLVVLMESYPSTDPYQHQEEK